MTIPLLAAILDPPPPEKAYLVSELDFSKKIKLQFNPDSLSISRSVKWSAASCPSKAYEGLAYGGSESDKLSVRVIIDTSIPDDPLGLKAAATQAALAVPGASPGAVMDLFLKSTPTSVLDTIDTLVEWTYPSMWAGPDGKEAGALTRPPAVAFLWGSKIKFFGAIQNLDFSLTLFDSDGTPVRAEGKLSLVGRREGPEGSQLTALHELFGEAKKKPPKGKESTGKTSDTESNPLGL